jgi:hypothetical protein
LWYTPESVFTQTIPLPAGGGVFAAALVVVLAEVFAAAGVLAVAGAAAGAAAGAGFDAGALDAEDAGAAAGAALEFALAFVFLLLLLVFAGAAEASAVLDESAAVLDESAVVAAAAVFFERDFLVVVADASAGFDASADFDACVESAVVFFERVFFVVVPESAADADVSVESAAFVFFDVLFVVPLAVESAAAFFVFFFVVFVVLSAAGEVPLADVSCARARGAKTKIPRNAANTTSATLLFRIVFMMFLALGIALLSQACTSGPRNLTCFRTRSTCLGVGRGESGRCVVGLPLVNYR